MILIAIFLQTTNQYMLLGVVPEPLSLLLFGVALIVLTFVLRWIFKRLAVVKEEEKPLKVKN